MPPLLLALTSVVLWSLLATIGTRLSHVAPFLLVGVALCLGGLIGVYRWRDWRGVTWARLALGVYGLFGFHFLLFFALRLAPPLEANLINYLWPLLIVLLAPWLVPHTRLTRWHIVGGVLGFAGACALLAKDITGFSAQHVLGYALAFLSATVWATYSLLTRRFSQQWGAAPNGLVGLYCLVSGVFSLLCHIAFETYTPLTGGDLVWLLILGAGPMGLAFYTWDKAFQTGDVRQLGALSYLTPLLSTCILWLYTADGNPLGWNFLFALLLIMAGAVLAGKKSS